MATQKTSKENGKAEGQKTTGSRLKGKLPSRMWAIWVFS